MERDPALILGARIVSAYVARNRIPAAALPGLIANVHHSVRSLGTTHGAPLRPDRTKPTVREIAASILPESLRSFEDGKRYKALVRHLSCRGLTPDTYRSKWGLPADYPMTSAAYSKRRIELARRGASEIGEQSTRSQR